MNASIVEEAFDFIGDVNGSIVEHNDELSSNLEPICTPSQHQFLLEVDEEQKNFASAICSFSKHGIQNSFISQSAN